MRTVAQACQVRDLSSAPEAPLPAWVLELAGPPGGARFRLARAGFSGVRGMDLLTFQEKVVDAYGAVFHAILQAATPSYPVRFWAFVPGIHDHLGVGLDRYMAFNVGRHAAFTAIFGPPTLFCAAVPTASTVGVHGDQLVLHCLAADEPGLPIENPRQVPAYHYSRRFGPVPPCFARAMLLGAQTIDPVLLVGGTASITGEESRYAGDLEKQTLETFRNLASLVASARGLTFAEDAPAADLPPLLAAFTELRVYYKRPADRTAIARFIQARFPAACRVELLQAVLCRSELLIEIEGLARTAMGRES